MSGEGFRTSQGKELQFQVEEGASGVQTEGASGSVVPYRWEKLGQFQKIGKIFFFHGAQYSWLFRLVNQTHPPTGGGRVPGSSAVGLSGNHVAHPSPTSPPAQRSSAPPPMLLSQFLPLSSVLASP